MPDHIELPNTQFAPRKSAEDRAIAPTTLKNKARPAQRGSANQAARPTDRLPWDETSHQAARQRIGAGAGTTTQP